MYGFWCERPIPPEFEKLLEGFAVVVGVGGAASDAFGDVANDVNVIIAGAGTRFDEAFLERVPHLKVIARTGIGVDNISLPAATARGIAICNAPDVPTTSTAEHTILLMFAATKHLKRVESVLKKGERVNHFTEHRAIELDGLRMGLVGLGRIGGKVAMCARGLGMLVTGFDPYAPARRFNELAVERASTLEELLRTADVVSLHVPSTPENYHLINAERMAQMKPGSYLINTSRGTLIKEDDLLEALERGHLHGAGLDVFDPEPPQIENPLLHRDDVVATPHVGGITVSSRKLFLQEAVTQSLQVLRGERPSNLVNHEVWPLSS